jgi:hypothetical protein
MVLEDNCVDQERVRLEWMFLKESCFGIEVYKLMIDTERYFSPWCYSFYVHRCWNSHRHRCRRQSWKVDWWHHGMTSHIARVGRYSKCVGRNLCKRYVNMAAM